MAPRAIAALRLASSAAIRRSGSSASAGQRPTSAGHQANSSCSSSGTTSAPVGQPRLPDEHHHAAGAAAPAPRPCSRSGATDHSSSSSRASVSTGFSPTSTAPPAPSAQRPAQEASHAARRPASQRPSASRTMHRTERLSRRVAGEQPQRPARRLQLEPQAGRRRASKPTSRAASPSWLGEPRSRSAASAASAAALGSRRRLERTSSSPGRVTCRGAPGPRASSAGLERVQPSRASSAYGSRPWTRAPQALGLGLRGRGAVPRRGRAAAAAGLAEHLGFGGAEPERAGAARRRRAARAAARAAGRAGRRSARPTTTSARSHAYGQVVPRRRARASAGGFDHAPDVVAPPARRGASVEARARVGAPTPAPRSSRSAAARASSAASSARVGDATPAWSRSTSSALDRVLEVDAVSRAARIQAGATGPRLEEQLATHGLTLRHFPQSFEFSTLGGWIATRAGGHFATLYTHIDDLVESVRAITPAGAWESRRLPGSGAGPSPGPAAARLRGDARRDHRGVGAGAAAARRTAPRPACASRTSPPGAEAVRALVAVGPVPANCRLIDAREAALTGAGDGGHALLVLGFESADHALEPSDGARARAVRASTAARGTSARAARAGGGRASALARGVPARALPARHVRRDRRAVRDVRDRDHLGSLRGLPRGGAGRGARGACARSAAQGSSPAASPTSIPDGPAPYFTVLAPARRGDELEQWARDQEARPRTRSSPRGGTITHHHAVGRDHRPWYDRQRPEPFAAALRAAKAAVDPAGMLNPGVLVDRAPAS